MLQIGGVDQIHREIERLESAFHRRQMLEPAVVSDERFVKADMLDLRHLGSRCQCILREVALFGDRKGFQGWMAPEKSSMLRLEGLQPVDPGSLLHAGIVDAWVNRIFMSFESAKASNPTPP